MSREEFIEQEHIIEHRPSVFIMSNSADDALSAQEKIERKGGIRMTVGMRESILGKVYDFKFKKSGDALNKLELKLSHRAMVASFGKASLEALAKIGPPYAVTAHDDHGDGLSGEDLENWRGRKINWRVGSLGYQIGMYVKDPLPMGNAHHYLSKFFTVKPGALADEIVAWQEERQKWIKEKREMQLKVNAVLNSVTTFNSLQKTWPDGERFWKHIPIDFPFRNQVPAVKVDELNDALGL